MIARAVVRDAVGPGALVLGGAVAIGVVSAGAGAVLGPVPIVDPAVWVAVLALAVPSSLVWAVPAAVAAGPASALARWVEEGAWAGARASGVGGRALLPALMALGLASGAMTGALAGYVDPIARYEARGRAADAANAVRLFPGQPLDVGGLVIVASSVDGEVASDVFLATPTMVGGAASASIGDMGGPVLVLADGTMGSIDGTPWRASFETWTVELPSARRRRIELDERTTPDLWALVERTEAEGRSAAYERAVAHKRVLHPVAAMLAPLAAAPLGARARPALGLAALAIGYLVAVRAGDHLAGGLPPLVSAATGPAWVAAFGVLAWAAWRDR